MEKDDSLIVPVVFSFPLSGPASDHQFSIEENETLCSGKIHHHHRRHTHSQETLCHTHNKNSEYAQPIRDMSICKNIAFHTENLLCHIDD